MRRGVWLWLAVLVLTLGVRPAGAFSTSIVEGSVAVGPAQAWRYTVSVPPLIMANPRIEGSLRASGGLGNDIKVYVFSEADYLNWANGHASNPLYESGQVSAADLNVSLPGEGRYVLVLSNTFSLMTPKTLAGTVSLAWDFPFGLVVFPVLGVWLLGRVARRGGGSASKPTREWKLSILESHVVTVRHGLVSGQVVVLVDGREVFRRESKLWDTGLEHRFELDGKPCMLRVLVRGTHAEYELWVDGRLQ